MYYTSKSVYEFISKQTSDPIIEWKTCTVSGTEFPIFKSDLDFYDKIAYNFTLKGEVEKIPIPTPTLCPEERQRRRLMFRNERKLYRRKCDASGKDIISIYSPDKPYKVYDQKYRWSDEWDSMKYGKDFDFNKPFFQQFDKVLLNIPHIALLNKCAENSEYCHQTDNIKDCYLIFGSTVCENSMYSYRITDGKNVIDGSFIDNSSLLYDCVDIKGSTNLYHSQSCINCSYSKFLFNCHGCSNCFSCVNLVNKQYCIFNKQLSKFEYEKKVSELSQFISRDFDTFKFNFFMKTTDLSGSQNATGNNINNSKNVSLSYVIHDSENIKYSYDLYHQSSNVMDCFSGYGPIDIAYECHSFGCGVVNNCFINDSYPVSNSFYCFNCYNCSNLFACIGLRNKSYCIFNKQYTKEEYENLVPKIITHMQETGEWGEFFNPSISPFGYNETVAQEYFPLTKEEALARGYKWQDKNYDPVIPENVKILKGDEIPNNISEVSDEILKQILMCEVSGRPFRIIKQELEFYRKNNLPLPRKHPDIRHEERLKQRPARELHLRNCDKCGIEMVSVYQKGTEQKVYCEACYNREIYG